MTAREVNPVIRALRENGIEVTALHSHMLTEQPRLFFMHFWATHGIGGLRRANSVPARGRVQRERPIVAMHS